MTYQDIVDRVAEIVRNINDDAQAHSLEDSLRRDFIEYLINTDLDDVNDIKVMAKMVNSTNALQFSRWVE